MNTHCSEPGDVASRPWSVASASLAREPETAWEAKGFADLVPPASLAEARAHRDDLARLLRVEREAAADFLLALADFDRRRGWERLGHASLFGFLTRELRLSSGAAQLRLSAARLLPRHPAVEAGLRSGQLCISAVGQLARVLTQENEAEVLPRFFGRSAREAQEVAAAILPCPSPPRREVITRRPSVASVIRDEAPPTGLPGHGAATAAPLEAHGPLHTYEVVSPPRAGAARSQAAEVPPTRLAPGREREHLSAESCRLHLTVATRFLEKVSSARAGLSHVMPGASTEQVLEAALDLLLEQQARKRSLVRRPRVEATPPAPSPNAPATQSGTTVHPATAAHGIPRHVPAAIEREVRLRDGNRCQFPLDAGGVCGSAWQVELDHVRPLALGGQTSVANLRCACRPHNVLSAEVALGAAVVRSTARRRREEPVGAIPRRRGSPKAPGDAPSGR